MLMFSRTLERVGLPAVILTTIYLGYGKPHLLSEVFENLFTQ